LVADPGPAPLLPAGAAPAALQRHLVLGARLADQPAAAPAVVPPVELAGKKTHTRTEASDWLIYAPYVWVDTPTRDVISRRF